MVRDIRQIFKNNDFIVALIFLATGAVLLQQTLLITVEQSRIFSYVAIGIIFISGIALMIRSFFKLAQNHIITLKFNRKELVILTLLIMVYFATSILGFYTAIYLFLIVSYLYIEGTWSKSAIKTSLIFNTILIVILYLSFNIFLGMVTPTGLLM